MIWSVIQVFSGQGFSFLTTIILAHLLSPTHFGLIGMATVWLSFFNGFSELGFGAALIQRRVVSPSHYSSVFYVNVAVGAILTFVGVCLSWPCAVFFSNPKVQPIMAALSLGFLFNSFSLCHIAIAQKQMHFKSLAIRNLFSSLAGAIMAIIAAKAGWGEWSLVVLTLVRIFVGTVLIWNLSPWRPVWLEFSLTAVRDLWGYGARVFAFSLFKFFAQNLDKIIVGHFMGADALGKYSFAYTLVVQPVAVVVGAVGGYLFPKLASLQDDLFRVRSISLKVAKSVGILLFPWLMVLFFWGGQIVSFLWGNQWADSIPVMKIFCVLAFVFAFISTQGQLMKALNRPEWFLIHSIFVAVSGGGLVLLGVHKSGIYGAAVGLTLSYVLGLPGNFFILNRLTGASFSETMMAVWPIPSKRDVIGLASDLWVELTRLRKTEAPPLPTDPVCLKRTSNDTKFN